MEKAIPTNNDARGTTSKIIPAFCWVPSTVAACLMVLVLCQARQIAGLKSQLVAARDDETRLSKSNALAGMRLETLDARDPAYASSKIILAWDPYRYRGVVELQNLPAPPAGHDYQLWVLDPGAEAPISAGLLTDSRPFTVKPLSTPSPGFAISLEASGDRPEPTGPTGPILFAVAPVP